MDPLDIVVGIKCMAQSASKAAAAKGCNSLENSPDEDIGKNPTKIAEDMPEIADHNKAAFAALRSLVAREPSEVTLAEIARTRHTPDDVGLWQRTGACS